MFVIWRQTYSKLLKWKFYNCHLNKYLFLHSREVDIEEEEKKVRKALKKCTKSLGKCSVEQTATLRAWSDKNKLDVARYRKQVQQELRDQYDDSDSDWKCMFYFLG